MQFPGQDASLDQRGLASNAFCNRDWQGNARPAEAADRFGLVPYDGPLEDAGRGNALPFWGDYTATRRQWDDPWNAHTGERVSRANMIFEDDLPPGDAVDTGMLLPNMAYLGIETAAGGGSCSGTVINRRQILTAAHCVDMADLENIRVGFGNPVNSPAFGVLSVSYHEDWTGNFFNGADIAIITLDDPVLFVSPVRLDGNNTSAAALGDTVFIGGYGSFGNPATGLVSAGDGQRRIGQNTLDFVGTISDVPSLAGLAGPGTQYPLFALDLDDPSGSGPNILGGGAIDGEAIASPGDSGGGLFIETADGVVQIGIVSFGYGVADPANRFTYGAADFYTPVIALRDWIDAASPFVQASTLGGDGSWTDAGHWADGAIPQNFGGPFTVAAGPLATPLYEVSLDLPGVTRIEDGDFFEIDTLALSDPDAALAIAPFGILVAESAIDVRAGAIQVDGLLGASQMRVQDGGELLVTETGIVIETAPMFDGGIWQEGGLIDVAGLVITDGLILSDGQFTLRDTGYYFDYGGSLVLGGRLDVDGYWDSELYTQLGGITDIGETGILFDYQGISLMGGGSLNVDGAFDTLAFLHEDGIVSGSGTILAPDLYLHAGGTIMPGGPVPGTLTIDGNYFMDSGAAGLFSLNADPALSNTLFVTGWAEIYGTIIPVFERDLPARGDSFVLVRTLDGTGGEPQLDRQGLSPMINFELSLTENALVLSLLARDFTDWAVSSQQGAVAGALDEALAPFEGELPSGSFGELVNTLDHLPEGEDVSRALESLNPTETFMPDSFGFALTRAQGNILAGRTAALARGTQGGYALTGNTRVAGLSGFAPGPASLALASSAMQLDAPRPAHAWDRLPDHTGVFLTGTVSSAGYEFVHGRSDSNMVFVTGGVDRRVGENALIGVSAGYGQFETRSQYRKAQGEALSVSLYGGYASDHAYISAYTGYALLDYDIARPVFLGAPGAGGTVLTARADTGGSQFMAGLDAGLSLDTGAYQWGPALRLRHTGADFDAYTETGAGIFGARLDARTRTETIAGFGAYLSQSFSENGRQSEIYVRGFHQIALSDSRQSARATLTGAPVSFAVQGLARDEQFYTVETGARIDISPRWSVDAAFSADAGRATGNETSLSLQASWRF